MSQDTVELMRAMDFAARKHRHQRRKGADAEPYINHPVEVARLLAEATGGRDHVLLVGGLLHDTIEDTDATRAEIAAAFGDEAAALVAEVSDDKSLSKAERKRLQIAHAATLSERAKMLKLADKTSNLRAITESPPPDWDLARKRDYFAWAAAVAEGCRGVNAQLEAWFDEAHAAGLAALDGAGRGAA